MSRNVIRCGLVAAVLVACPLSANAEATAEGAAAIRDGIEGWLEAQIVKLPDGIEVMPAGPVRVEPDGERYRARLPPLNVQVDDDTRFTVTAIPIDLVPAENGWFDVSWRLPESIVIRDPAGLETARLTVADQSGSGIFAPEICGFMAIDQSLGGAAMTVAVDGSGFAIDRLSLKGTYSEIEDGIYDQPGEFALEGLKILDPDGVTAVELEHLGFGITYRRLRFAELLALMEKIGAIAPGAPAHETADRLADIFEATPELLSGVEISHDLAGLAVHVEGIDVVLPAASLGVTVAGLDTPTVRIGLTLGVSDVAIEPPPPHSALVPATGGVELDVENLPADALAAAFVGLMRANGLPEDEQALQMAAIGEQILTAILSRGVRLTIDRLGLANAIASAELTGELVPDLATALGFRGKGSMAIRGLAPLIEQAKADAVDQEALLMLVALQGLGRATVEGDVIVHRYDWEVTESGRGLVNGVDLSLIAHGSGSVPG